jgi:hypothetical protein
MTPKLATIADTLYERTVDLAGEITAFLSKESRDFVEISAEADKLGRVDGAARSLVLARLNALAGDRERVDYYLENAKRLHADALQFDLAQITALLSLGYFSEASRTIHKFGEAHQGRLNLFLEKPPLNGLFHLMESFYLKAKSMNLANVAELPATYTAAVPIMDSWGDTDEDYSAALDVAGKVMRQRRMFFGQHGVIIDPVATPLDGSPPYVKMSFKIDVDFNTALDMTCEYAEELAMANIKIPQSLVFEFLPAAV